MRAYIDADVIIWHLRGEQKAAKFLQGLAKGGEYELWTGALQRAEVIFFMRPEEETGTFLFLSEFETASVDQATIDLAGTLYRKWHPSHGVDIHDAILAATAIHTGGHVFGLNKKHYPMPDVVFKRAW